MDEVAIHERHAHRWRLWLLLVFQLPALALLLYASFPGPWLAAVWGMASSLLATDSDTPWLNRLFVALALGWPLSALIR